MSNHSHTSVDLAALNAPLASRRRRVRYSETLGQVSVAFSWVYVLTTYVSTIVQNERLYPKEMETGQKVMLYMFALPMMLGFAHLFGWMGCSWIANLFSGFSAWFDPETNNSSHLNSCRNRRHGLWLVMVMMTLAANSLQILHQEGILFPTLGAEYMPVLFTNWIVGSMPLFGVFLMTLVLAFFRCVVLWVVSWFVTPDEVPHVQMVDIETTV